MKNKKLIDYLDRFSSSDTRLLERRDDVVAQLKFDEFPEKYVEDGCPQAFNLNVPHLCEEHEIEDSMSKEQDEQCLKCWMQILIVFKDDE